MLKTLQVSTFQVHDWDAEQLVLEGGMVPDYVNLFPPMFTKVFMCVFMALYHVFCLCFLSICVWACKYLNVVGSKTLRSATVFYCYVLFPKLACTAS